MIDILMFTAWSVLMFVIGYSTAQDKYLLREVKRESEYLKERTK